MKKNFLCYALIGIVFSSMMISCGDKQHPDYQKTSDGLYYKHIVSDTGMTVKNGDVVKMDIAYYLNDSLLMASEGQEFFDLVRESVFAGDLYEGLRMMHKGDSMSLIMNADSVFLLLFGAPQLPGFVKPNSEVRFEIKVLDFQPEEEFLAAKNAEMDLKNQESAAILAQYLADNNITATPTESGLVYVQTKKGVGSEKPQMGQTVKVHYVGKLLDGTVFDSSVERGEPFEFPLGMHYVIPGWDEGIALMTKGEKGILYLPSSLAYGGQQTGSIPPFSNLMFEVELIDFYTKSADNN